jgi:Uma2 family endonuclease
MTAELVEDVTLRMPRLRGWTWADLQEIRDEGHRYEILDGSLHVSASPTPRHQIAAGRLRDVLLAAAPDELEVVEAVDIDFGPSVLEPDVLVVPAAAAFSGRPKFVPEDLLLVVEVVSPSSRRMDRMMKPSILAEFGVPAYWRVELDGPGTPLVVTHALDEGVYREVVAVRAGESVVVDVPFPVELRPAELVGPRRRS